MRPQPGTAALAGEPRQRVRRAVQPVADPSHLEDASFGMARRHLSPQEADHRVVPALSARVSALARPWRLRWQMASAQASAASAGRGAAGRLRTAATMDWTWRLGALPTPTTD